MILLFMLQPIPEFNHDIDEQQISYSTLKATGVDLSVTEISYTYTNPTDQQKYQMFSSNHPIQNFNKPEQLFVIDAVVFIRVLFSSVLNVLASPSVPPRIIP